MTKHRPDFAESRELASSRPRCEQFPRVVNCLIVVKSTMLTHLIKDWDNTIRRSSNGARHRALKEAHTHTQETLLAAKTDGQKPPTEAAL